MDSPSRHLFSRLSGLHGMADSSLKQLIAWGDHLKVDQDQIDAQHEGIFNIAMEVADAWHQHRDLEHLKGLAEKLTRVLEAHFRYEEKQLAAVNYPLLAEHQAEHQVMLDELQLIRQRLDTMGQTSAPRTPGFIVYNYILGITVGHIGHSDMAYCAYARKAADEGELFWPTS